MKIAYIKQIQLVGILVVCLVACKKAASISPSPATDIPPLPTPTLANSLGLLGEWPLDGNVVDVSGNGNNGTLIGAAIYTTGKRDQGVGLSGNGSYVKVPESPTLQDGSSGLTVSVWIKMNRLPKLNVYYAPVAKEHSYRFIISSDGGAHFVAATSNNGWYSEGTVASFKSRLSAGVWTHLVATYNGQRLQVYLNGAPAGAGSPISGTICAHAKPMGRHTTEINAAVTFGAKTAGNLDYTDGIIDEVRIYNQALSAEEVLALFASYENKTP